MSDNPVFADIQKAVDENEVLLFMKGNPMFPQCGFSATVVQILSHLGVKFKGINVLEDMEIREGIKQFSTCWPMTHCATASRNIPTGRPSRSFTSRASLSAVATSSVKCSTAVSWNNCSRTRAFSAPPDPD